MPETFTAEHPADIVHSFAEHRRFLHNLAAMQLNSRDEADDAVQDTFAAAIDGVAGFSGQVPVRAWLVGILRNKIVDAIRRRARYIRLDPADALPSDDAEFDDRFTADGCWQPGVLHAAGPESSMAYRQLLELVDLCLQKLPANTGRVFLMREFLGLEFTEIASQLELAEGHLRVLLYRARMRLRDCVSRGWEDA
ncbi:MAG: sigma-70 family RNA polymerase sigma factor [Gammaproteobacteria bacterium]|jgi:RNA polymerase sigma-70 factor, ECF subfamily|nr:sigma-70 family RNA polymerase sigma factor [Gammaproteobacteria bacterium]MBU0772962.1 sigma-70 family RNA polymerase sigma factor [Gammaproteobacteria bacterium]MBU0857645.1 sigma-70 family RNA polymerase sigma factor [Gammaproteobacteria bacterium]MBU1848611.1 sigma-70 family RNA polymerase sigma factor [Gammaproteobacteria bacterium]